MAAIGIDMNKNVIYSCYTTKNKPVPAFARLHKMLTKQYADRIGCDYICMDEIDKNYHPLSFVVYEAYNHFCSTDYDKMLYVDWDIIISKKAPDIFEQYRDSPFCALRWRDAYTDSTIKVKSVDDFIARAHDEEIYKKIEGAPDVETEAFVYFLKYCCDVTPDEKILTDFLNMECSGGVMLFDRPTMNRMLHGDVTWEQLYNQLLIINTTDTENDHINMLKDVGVTQSKYLIDYLRIRNNVPFDISLDKKWNSSSVIGDMVDSDYFFSFNGACATSSSASVLSQKDVSCFRFVKNNKHIFFDSDDEYYDFCKKNLSTAQLLEIYKI